MTDKVYVGVTDHGSQVIADKSIQGQVLGTEGCSMVLVSVPGSVSDVADRTQLFGSIRCSSASVPASKLEAPFIFVSQKCRVMFK